MTQKLCFAARQKVIDLSNESNYESSTDAEGFITPLNQKVAHSCTKPTFNDMASDALEAVEVIPAPTDETAVEIFNPVVCSDAKV